MGNIHISTLLKHYKREDVQRAIVDCADNKEIAVKFGDRGFGKRPDVLKYPRDVLEFAKKGATSFHCSEELWTNPLSIVTGMKPKELNELRKGWDLVLDIDCPELEYSKLAGFLLVEALKHYDVKDISVKFSGNHGFHIAVPFESFPDTVVNTPLKDLFPEGPKRVAIFLQEKIRDLLSKKLLEMHDVDTIAKNVNKPSSELIKDGEFNPFEVLAIDTILISPRHLYRMPWSFNEKSGLVSVVIDKDSILSFDKSLADPAVVTPSIPFLDRKSIIPGSAKRLFVEAFDFKPNIVEEVKKKEQEFEPMEDTVPEEFFPPCIHNIKKGIEDGKKRAVLILINFLSSVGWPPDMIESYLEKWNKNNPDPLRPVYYQGQLRYHKQQKKRAPPPNCDNKAYMLDIGVCTPDSFCKRVRNPSTYAIWKYRANESGKKGRKHSKMTTE